MCRLCWCSRHHRQRPFAWACGVAGMSAGRSARGCALGVAAMPTWSACLPGAARRGCWSWPMGSARWPCTSLDELLELRPQVVVEAASADGLAELGPRIIHAGADLIALSPSCFIRPEIEAAFRAAVEQSRAGGLPAGRQRRRAGADAGGALRRAEVGATHHYLAAGPAHAGLHRRWGTAGDLRGLGAGGEPALQARAQLHRRGGAGWPRARSDRAADPARPNRSLHVLRARGRRRGGRLAGAGRAAPAGPTGLLQRRRDAGPAAGPARSRAAPPGCPGRAV